MNFSFRRTTEIDKMSMKDSRRRAETGSIHLGYQSHIENRLRETLICGLIEKAACAAGKTKETFRVLDVGCGSGHLMKTGKESGIPIAGVDVDPVCVKLSSNYGESLRADGNELERHFTSKSFDCLVFSHSLEHLDNPLNAVGQAKRLSRRFLIFAVPNPCRLQTILISNPLRYDYSNLGHLCCWDRSHFSVFLTERCGLEILNWETYKIGLFSLSSAFVQSIRKTRSRHRRIEGEEIHKRGMRRGRKFLTRLFKKASEPVEVCLAKMFPYLADELLVLTEIPEAQPEAQKD